ncbi:MAG: DUF1989 domain-containing protein, partial [Candidatus Dormibacteria bacterium]
MTEFSERELRRTLTVPARCGNGLTVARGTEFRVINLHGTQVVDMWAFSDADHSEFMAMEHSRVTMGRWRPIVGNTFVTNCRRPILTIIEDTTPGVHDTTFAACDRYRYELLGHRGYHDNCTDNLAAVLKEQGKSASGTPCPLNLFMNVGFPESGEIVVRPPVAGAGRFVGFRAEMDCFVAFSSCPQDILPVNGADCVPQ